MKVLRGTLTFVLGMIIGIILFVLAIGGTAFALATATTVGDLQTKLGADIINEDSEAYNKSLFDVVKDVISDVKQIDQMSLQDIIDKYGVSLPDEISGIDITEAYKYPIAEISDHVDEIVNSISLNEIGEAAGIDWDEINLPIVKDNLDSGVTDAINAILKSIDGNITIRQIKDKFGIDIGAEDNTLFKKLQDLPLSSLGGTINYLRLNDVLNASTDTFIAQSSDIYVQVDVYEEVSKSELTDSSYSPALGIETYIAGTKDLNNDGEDDSILEKELRYIKKDDGSYMVDNSSYLSDFDSETETIYYRHIEYKQYAGETGVDYYIPSYANIIDTHANSLLFKGFVKAQSNTLVNIGSKTPTNKILASPIAPYTYYGFNGSITKDSRLEAMDTFAPYVLLEEGTSSAAVKSISYKTIEELQNDSSFLDNLTLGEVLDIDDSSSRIMITLQDTKLSELSTAVDDLYLYQIMDITMDDYTKDADGLYVKITVGDTYYFTLYNPAYHNSSIYERYSKTEVADASSKVLQRLRTAKIGTFSDDFKDLTLSDVLDITPNIYEKITYTSPSDLLADTDYYYFDSTQGLYLLADSEYIADHCNSYVYKVAKLGEGSKIIQRLAYVKVDDLSQALETIIDDMYLSDVMDIISNYAVEEVSGTVSNDNENFIVDSFYTDENGDEIAYIYDSDGKYIRRQYEFVETPISSLTPISTSTVKFTQVADRTEAKTYATALSLYYSGDSGATFKYNPQLVSYIVTKSTYDQSVDGAKLYKGTIDSSGSVTYNVFDNSSDNLYVLIAGYYVPYDPSLVQHLMQTTLYVKTTHLCYVNIGDPIPSDDATYAYNSSTDPLLSRVYCETIYVANNSGNFVFYDNAYVTYDSTNLDHQTLQRFSAKTGYLASTSEAYYKVDGHYQTTLTVKKVSIINSKSARVLIMLKNSKTTIKNMSDVIDNATIKDLIDVDPDSVFAIEFEKDGAITSLKECCINDMSGCMSAMFKSLDIGTLLNISNIQTVNPNVKEIIKDISLPTFFKSLKYDSSIGIVVDIEVLYEE